MKAVAFERGDNLYLITPVAPVDLADTQIDELAFSTNLKTGAPNERLVWLRGQYVEADRPNRNGAMWLAQDLELKSLTPKLMPVTVMHDPRTAVGLIADTQLVQRDEQAGIPRTRIDTVLALWAHRFPDIVEEVADNYAQGTLMQSMECVPLDTEILTRRGWKRYDELRPTDETLGYDQATGKNRWTVIESVIRKRGDVVSLGQQHWRARCTKGHRWLAATGKRVGSKYQFSGAEMVNTSEIDRRHQLILTARAELDHPDGSLQITPAEASIIGWIAGDGSYKVRRGGMEVAIYQSKPDGIMALELDLARAGVEYRLTVKEPNDGTVGIKQNFAPHTYRIPGATAKDLWARAELDHLTWEGFILRLSSEARGAWLEAMYAAEGNENHGSRCIAQKTGPLKDAIALCAYLEGYRPVSHEFFGDNSQATSHVRLNRNPVNGERLTMVELGEQEVWCPVTGLGTWTMRQDDRIMLTGNCHVPSYECGDCGQQYVRLPDGAERENWCDHLRGETAGEGKGPVRRLLDVTFTGTGLIFGSRGARGALDSAHLDVFQDEVASFHEAASRATTRKLPRSKRKMEIEDKRYEELVAAEAKTKDLATQLATVEEVAAQVPVLEKTVEQLEIDKKKAEDDLAAEKTQREALQEAARAVTLATERTGKLGASFIAKLPETVKVRLDEQAKTLTDEAWAERLDELATMLGVKHDDDTPIDDEGATFTRDELARADLVGAGSGSSGPSQQMRQSVIGGLVTQLRKPAKSE